MEENKINEAVENKAEDTKTPSIDELMTQVKNLQTQLEKQKDQLGHEALLSYFPTCNDQVRKSRCSRTL